MIKIKTPPPISIMNMFNVKASENLQTFALPCMLLTALVGFDARADGIDSPQAMASLQVANTELHYDVPKLSERGNVEDEDADEGPKIRVKAIKVHEVYGTSTKEIPLSKPYDDEEIQSIISQRIVKYQGDMTYFQLQRLANDISKYLNLEKGFLLAKAYLPAQKVNDGVLRFDLLNGKLGTVRVEGNTLYDSSTVTSFFAEHTGKVIKRSEAEETLLRLGDLPGFSAAGIFEPGDRLGYTNLVLGVTEEKLYEGIVFMDNSGSAFTGRIRGGARFNINNFFNFKDQIRVLTYFTQVPNGVEKGASYVDEYDCCNGSIGYEAGMEGVDKFRVGFEVSKSNYDIGDVEQLTLSSFKFEGKTWGVTGYVNYPLMRGRQHNAVIRFGVSNISAKTLRSDDTQSEDKMRVYDATYNFDLSESFLGSAKNAGSVKLSSGKLFRGEVDRNSRLQADQTFIKLNYSFNRSQRLSTEPTTVLNFKLNGQFTQDKLVGVQQLGIGGPSSVRGYPTGTFLADKGAYAAADLYWYASDEFNPFVFVDYASASVVEGESFTNNNVHLGSYGFGVNWGFGGATFDLTAARAIGSDGDFAELISNGGKDAVGRKSTQVFISMKYDF